MRIVLIGCGKMGLPLAAQAAARGNEVMGVDADPRVVEAINAGRCHIDEPGVADLVAEGARAGRLTATTDLSKAAAWAEAIIVLVPVKLTPDKREDLSILLDVTRRMAPALSHGVTVSFETTLPVGTTRTVLQPILESSGRRVEEDLFLVFSPERVKSQKVMAHLNDNPKIVGGAGPKSLARGVALYHAVLGAGIIELPSLEESEMAKLAGMAYRDVNIALANELAGFCEARGMDAARVFAAANTDGESFLLAPGIGVGGHCTPVYPYFLLGQAPALGLDLALTGAARRINDGQAVRQTARLEAALGGLAGRRVLILGLSFRPGVPEDYCSPAFLLREALAAKGATVLLNDPLYPDSDISARGFTPYSLASGGPLDAAVLVTAHKEYADLDWGALHGRGLKVFLDGRSKYDAAAIEAKGVRVLAVGRGAAQ